MSKCEAKKLCQAKAQMVRETRKKGKGNQPGINPKSSREISIFHLSF